MFDSLSDGMRYPIETEEAFLVLENLVYDNSDLEIVLRRARAFSELKNRGDRGTDGYSISNCFANTVCFNFAQYIKTGCLFSSGTHHAERESGELITVEEASDKFGLPFLARFYSDDRLGYEDGVLEKRQIVFDLAQRGIQSIDKLKPFVSEDPYTKPSIPTHLLTEVEVELEAKMNGAYSEGFVFDNLNYVVPDDTFSCMHAGVIVGINEKGFCMLDKDGPGPVRAVSFDSCNYKSEADLILFEGFDTFNSAEARALSLGGHSWRDENFDRFGRKK